MSKAALAAETSRVLKGWRSAFYGVGAFSVLINVLMLTGAFYMLQVYDRVLPSRSVPTLIGLSLLVLILFAAQGILEVVRSRILLRIGRSLDEQLSARVFAIIARLPLVRPDRRLGLQPLRDLDQIRGFFANGGPVAFFDLPWLPLYLAICFIFHPLIGFVALVGAVVLFVLALLTESFARAALKSASEQGLARSNLAEASRRNAEVLAAMSMTKPIAAIWDSQNQKYLAANGRASDIAGTLGAISRMLRIALQSGVLGLAAYLAIRGEATAGIVVASAILTTRALAPVDTVIGKWKAFISARQSWERLNALLNEFPEKAEVLALRAPSASLSVENISVAPPGEQRLVIKNVSFQLQSGSALGVIGPTAAGKSTLARALVGIWSAARGTVRLDAAALEQWSADSLGRYIGYLPQDIELFDGTVAQNIARFDPDASAEAIIGAAEAAGVHGMVLGLPDGYETPIGEGGVALSAGQRQRIGLARALYGEPFLVVLDEPNANLDSDGDEALNRAILGIRKRGGITVIIAHRPSALAAVDLVMMLKDGEVQAFGPQRDVLRKVLRSVPDAQAVVSGGSV